MRAFAEDLTLALRFLRRRPAVNVFIVAVLGLGIGTAAAVFSLVNALLIRPLPFAQPERLMSVPLTVPPSSYRPGGGDNPWWSYPKLEIFRDLQRAFDRVAVYATRTVTVAATGMRNGSLASL
jgi:hypothetical protein